MPNKKLWLYAGAGVGVIALLVLATRGNGALKPLIMSPGLPIPGGLQPIGLNDGRNAAFTPPPADDFANLLAALAKDDCACQSCTDNAVDTLRRPVVHESAIMPPQAFVNDYVFTPEQRAALNNGTAELVLDDISSAGFTVASYLNPLSGVPNYMILPKDVGGDLFSFYSDENPAGDVSNA